MTTLYFAYGSNLDGGQMRARVPGAKKLDVGCLEGYEFGFAGHSRTWNGPVATIRKTPGSVVWGVVYELPAGGLPALDRFEGYPRVYQRKTVSVRRPSGAHVDAVTYYLPSSARASAAIPNPEYVQRIVRALGRHGIARQSATSCRMKGPAR